MVRVDAGSPIFLHVEVIIGLKTLLKRLVKVDNIDDSDCYLSIYLSIVLNEITGTQPDVDIRAMNKKLMGGISDSSADSVEMR